MDFNKLTRKFLLGEWKQEGISSLARAQAISLNLRTIKERQRVEVALENLAHLRRNCRKLEERNAILTEENQQLTEKLQILEESRGDE